MSASSFSFFSVKRSFDMRMHAIRDCGQPALPRYTYPGCYMEKHLSRDSPPKGRGKNKERKKKRRAKSFFFAREKMATAWWSFADIRTQAMTARSAAQHQSSKCCFPRSALQTSPYGVRKTTKISTTCTYYREILTVRALRSSRTIEYYVLLSLRTIEKRKDWIWIVFQSGPAFFVRTIENYVLLSIRTIEKWL